MVFTPRASPDVDCGHHRPRRHFERLQAGDTEVVQEHVDQPYGIRDCAFRDPAGNVIRIQELS